VKNGLDMEAFLDTACEAQSGKHQLVVHRLQPRCAHLIRRRSRATAGERISPRPSAHGEVIPHIWLDPLRAVAAGVKNIGTG